MDTKALRQKILDLAIHGKLVPQDPNDEPASVLLQRIREEKERLVKEGKIKKGKKAVKASEAGQCENVPFEVPASWKWITLGDYVYSVTDGDHQAPPKAANGIPFLVISNLTDGTLDFNDTRHVPQTYYDSIQFERKAQKGDILFTVTGSYGIVVKVNTKEPFCFQRHIGLIKPMNDNECDYLAYILRSKYIKKLCDEQATGTAQKTVGLDTLRSFYIPIPPLAEQRRIVAEIERWFSLIDKIENGKESLQAAVKQAKAKILDLAIHGKLVPQDPADEPASELLRRINPKAEITSDDAQYGKVPEGWAVCYLENVAKVLDNLRKPINSDERNSRIANKAENELYPYYGATGQVGFIDDFLIDGTYLLLGEDGAPFLDKNATKAYSVKGKCWVNNHAHILEPLCNHDYLRFYLNQMDYKDYVNGSTRLKLTQRDMQSIVVLLPPLAEQRRIVAKIEELFAQLDLIEAAL